MFAKKEFNNLPECDEEWKWKGLTKKQLLIILLLFCYVILMIVSGLFTHYVFCEPYPRTKAADLNMTTMTLNVSNLGRSLLCPTPANCPRVPPCQTLPFCPGALPLPCPTLPAPTACPASPPPCINNCFTTCAPVTTTTPPPIVSATDRELNGDNTTNPLPPLDLIRRFNVQTFNRLQIITQLMESYFEKYHTTYTRRNCGYDVRRICPLCKDRYAYMRCLYIHDVNAQRVTPLPINGTTRWEWWWDENLNHRAWETSNRSEYNTEWTLRGEQYTRFYDDMHKMMSFTFNQGKAYCTPCDGETAEAHQKCIAHKESDWENANWKTPYWK